MEELAAFIPPESIINHPAPKFQRLTDIGSRELPFFGILHRLFYETDVAFRLGQSRFYGLRPVNLGQSRRRPFFSQVARAVGEDAFKKSDERMQPDTALHKCDFLIEVAPTVSIDNFRIWQRQVSSNILKNIDPAGICVIFFEGRIDGSLRI
ncbi:MAG: hypothetical protein JRI56_13070 [Deltaproteobacteria bacterium]|nr:hypothetical protein [Deltaproteobacteria bacterium]